SSLVSRSMLVSRGTSVRKANVCALPDPRNSQSFQLRTNPFFFIGAPTQKPDRGAHFAKIQTKANSQYALQKAGVNIGSDHADHRGACRDSFLAFARSATKNHETKPFLDLRPPYWSARRSAPK